MRTDAGRNETAKMAAGRMTTRLYAKRTLLELRYLFSLDRARQMCDAGASY